MDHIALRKARYFKDANPLRLQGLANDPKFFLVGYFNGHSASKSIVRWYTCNRYELGTEIKRRNQD